MNGQHLRALPSEELTKLIGERWKSTGVLTESEGPFIEVRGYCVGTTFGYETENISKHKRTIT